MAASARVCDFAIVGAGIVGVNIAAVLRERFPAAAICIFDKERDVGRHASGRNSGVLHAGFYYHPDSLKATLTMAGNRYLTSYCTTKQLPLNRCGKLVLARSEHELPALESLLQRGIANGSEVFEVSAARAAELEPLCRTHHRALWSPQTAVADPALVLREQLADVLKGGVELRLGEGVTNVQRGPSSTTLYAENGTILTEAGHVINAAGLHADTVARRFGFGADFSMIPMKGLYLYCNLPIHRLLYPVPDPAMPFLGVHFTSTLDGRSKVGPTAVPALWRENYGGVDGTFHAFDPREMADILGREAWMFATDPAFRRLALGEVLKYRRSAMVQEARTLVPSVTEQSFTHYGRAGIRAQLVHKATQALVMDFVLEGDAQSTHVLNAVSPGWTCSRPVAEMVVQRLETQ